MFDGPSPHLFYLPPGVDFATHLVLGLKERLAGQVPEAMARVRLFLNSQRMRHRVIEVMTGEGATFLPVMSVVSELGDDISLADLAPPVPKLRRRLELARLIAGLLRAQPDLAPMSARFDLAAELADLLGEMQDEAVSADTIAGLDVSGHSEHWARTQQFLAIIAPYVLEQDDMQSRQRQAVLRLAALWQEKPPDSPVIIAGSTGSRGTTAQLMRTIAGLAQGAVVVPGFDSDLPAPVWDAMGDGMTAEDHPQFRFRRLMEGLGVPVSAFGLWRQAAPPDPDRNRLISLALRPAPVTDQWLVEGQALPDLVGATAAMTLIEAAGPRQEALAIALVLRHAVERGERAALITPDRGLTRRVAAALQRWGIVADDSAGSPLALSAPGRLLRLVAGAFGQALTSERLLTLLKHPLVASGAGRGRHLAHTRRLELDLRRSGPAFPTQDDILTWAARPDRAGAMEWARELAPVIGRFGRSDSIHLTDHVSRHLAVTETLAGGGTANLWQGAAGQEARQLMDQLQAEAPHGDAMSALDYLDLFDALVQEGEVREVYDRHPLVAFYGHREARELHADCVILGGLTDGVWPASANPDPWLNRKMRHEAGLLLPERQIGLAAHDFQQAVAAKTVILTRATRDAEAETVPSRWLNRLCNLTEGLPDRRGPEALAAMRERGRRWLDLTAAIEQPMAAQTSDPRLAPAVRPKPQPPLAVRPPRLALTRIATLIRDPYAIYARFILRLKPLDPLRHHPEDRDRGTAIHQILETFVKERPTGETTPEAKVRLLLTARRVLAATIPFPSARLLWLARLERAADHFLRHDTRYGGATVLLEEQGSLAVGATGFTLFGTPDRIDLLADGRLHLIDYKSGSPPTKPQQEAYDKQLLLAAAMAERGGFASLGRAQVARITYIGLGSGEKAVDAEVTSAELDDLWDRFCHLIAKYHLRETGYTARRAVFETRRSFDYDHLSRFGEWQMSDPAMAILLGGADDA